MIGLNSRDWTRLTEELPADARGYLLDLLIWTWAHHAPLPASEAARMRIARCHDRKRWRVAWTLLEPLWTAEGEFPAQTQARAEREKKRRAGKASAAKRAAQQHAQQALERPAQTARFSAGRHGADHPPVENPVENPLTPVENRGKAVEIDPPTPPPYVQRSSQYQDRKTEVAAGAAPPPTIERRTTEQTTEEAASQVIQHVLSSGRPLPLDDYRDQCYAVAMELWPRGTTAPGWVDQVLALTYSTRYLQAHPAIVVRADTVELRR